MIDCGRQMLCALCEQLFWSLPVQIGFSETWTDLCLLCRDKAHLEPDFLPPYLTVPCERSIGPEWMPLAS